MVDMASFTESQESGWDRGQQSQGSRGKTPVWVFNLIWTTFLLLQLMEYQLKKEGILASVEFSNLLTFSLVENKLERNFKSLVEALLLQQDHTQQLSSRTQLLQEAQLAAQQQLTQNHQNTQQALQTLHERLARLESKTHQPSNSQRSIPRLPSTNLSPLPSHPEHRPSQDQTDLPNPQTTQSERDHQHESEQQRQREAEREAVRQAVRETEKQNQRERERGENGLGLRDRRMQDLEHQVSKLKGRVPDVQMLEEKLEAVKRELTALKGELMTFGAKSNKSVKRESIAGNLSTNNLRRQSNGGRPGSRTNQGNSAGLLNSIDNKENNSLGEQKGGAKAEGSGVHFQKDLEGLHLEVNTLNLCFQQLKGVADQLRKRDLKHHAALIQVEDKQKRMQDEMRKDSENFEKQLKLIQLAQINSPPPAEDREKQDADKKSPKRAVNHDKERVREGSESREDILINFKNQLNDRISRLQTSLQGFVTEAQWSRFKGECRDRLGEVEGRQEKIEKELEEETRKIYDMLINKDIEMGRLGESIQANSETIRENNAQADRKHNIAMARIEELKKGLQNLREDVEFYQSLNADTKDKKADNDKQPTEQDNSHKEKTGVDSRALEDIKRHFSNKLHDQRAYLVGLVRELEKKQQSGSNLGQEIANIWDKLQEMGVFLGRKADQEDIKKSLLYLQKKIGRVSAHLLKAEDNTEDARIAKTNWFCLSCDKNLLGYQGKIGRHVVWDQIPLKGLAKGVDRKGLPSLKK